MPFIDRNPAIYVQDTIVPLEDGVQFLNSTEDVRTSEIERTIKEIEIVKQAIVEVSEQRSTYVRTHSLLDGEDPDSVTPRVIITDITVRESEQAVSHLDHKTIYINNPSNLPVEDAISSILDPVKYIDLKLRDFDALLYKLSFKESKLRVRLNKLQTWELSSNKKKKEKVSEYKDLVERRLMHNDFIAKIDGLIKSLADFSKAFDFDKKKKLSHVLMGDLCNTYNKRRKDLIESLEYYETRFPGGLFEINQDLPSLIVFLMDNLPKQFTDALDARGSIVASLDDYRGLLVDAYIVMKNKMNTLVEQDGIKNNRVRRLLKRARSYFQSPAVDTLVNRELTPEASKSEFQRRENQVVASTNRFKELLKKAADYSTVPTDLLSKFQEQILANLNLGRTFSDEEESGSQALENYWRDRVRKKFGGNIPFCDEVEIKNIDGTTRYIKRVDAIEVSPGVFRDKKEVNLENLKVDLLSKQSDLY